MLLVVWLVAVLAMHGHGFFFFFGDGNGGAPDVGGAVVHDEELIPFVLDLIAHLKAGENLYIHCSDGNGRTGTVACALLGLLYNLSSSETLDIVQRYRNHRTGTQGHMPESHEQKMQVHRLLFDKRLRPAAAAVAPKSVRSLELGGYACVCVCVCGWLVAGALALVWSFVMRRRWVESGRVFCQSALLPPPPSQPPHSLVCGIVMCACVRPCLLACVLVVCSAAVPAACCTLSPDANPPPPLSHPPPLTHPPYAELGPRKGAGR